MTELALTLTSKQSKVATKVASKIISKKSKPLKLKKLCKKLHSKLLSTDNDNEQLTIESLTKFLQTSDMFDVGKDGYIGITEKKKSKKRKGDDDVENENEMAPNKKNKSSCSNEKDQDIPSWRIANKIVVEAKGYDKDADFLIPVRSFSEEAVTKVSINETLLKYCTDTKKFSIPSPIQAQCWPILAKGKHVVGIAETGSGKTLAFAMPALSIIKARKKVQMLVLAPTRELAMQSHDVLDEFGALVGLQSMVVYGGVSKADQIRKLKKDCPQCVVATPGRLVDLLSDRSCDLSNVHYLV